MLLENLKYSKLKKCLFEGMPPGYLCLYLGKAQQLFSKDLHVL